MPGKIASKIALCEVISQCFLMAFHEKHHKGSSLGIKDALYSQSVAMELGKEVIRGFSSRPAFALTRPAAMLCLCSHIVSN